MRRTKRATEIRELRSLLERITDAGSDLADIAEHHATCPIIPRCTCDYGPVMDAWDDLLCEHESLPYIERGDRWREVADRLYEALGHSPQARVSIEGRAAILAYREEEARDA